MYEIKQIDTVPDNGQHLFVSKSFVEYQSRYHSKPVVTLGVFDESRGDLLAHLCLARENEELVTPIVGAFGGLVIKKGASFAALESLLDAVDQHAKSNHIKTLTIKLPPTCYADDSPLIGNMLFRKGWELDRYDLNFHIPITTIEQFMSELGETKRKIIRRLERAGASFAPLGQDELQDVYNVIAVNRHAQGYPVTMSCEAIKDLAMNMKENFLMFGVRLGDELIASAICLSVSPDYLYVFYWGELPAYRSKSPVVMLAKGIVEYCIEHGKTVMDIGTSTLASELNEGLCKFKLGLGCQITPKFTYTKECA